MPVMYTTYVNNYTNSQALTNQYYDLYTIPTSQFIKDGETSKYWNSIQGKRQHITYAYATVGLLRFISESFGLQTEIMSKPTLASFAHISNF